MELLGSQEDHFQAAGQAGPGVALGRLPSGRGQAAPQGLVEQQSAQRLSQLGRLALGEPVSAQSLLGALLIVAGVTWAALRGDR